MNGVLLRRWCPSGGLHPNNGVAGAGVTLNVACVQWKRVAIGKTPKRRVIDTALEFLFARLLQKYTSLVQATVPALDALALDGGWDHRLNGDNVVEIMFNGAFTQGLDVDRELFKGLPILQNKAGF